MNANNPPSGDPREVGYQMHQMYDELENAPKEVVDEHYRKKQLSYNITINAPIQTVFKAMTDKSMYPEWAKAWGEDMTFEGTWKEGEHISFVDASGEGTKAVIETLQDDMIVTPIPNSDLIPIPSIYVRMFHTAMVKEGQEVTDLDDTMKKWIGSEEVYDLSQHEENETRVNVHILTDESFEPMMNAWPKALNYLKEICEA